MHNISLGDQWALQLASFQRLRRFRYASRKAHRRQAIHVQNINQLKWKKKNYPKIKRGLKKLSVQKTTAW